MRTAFAREETEEYQDTLRALLRLCAQWCDSDGRTPPDPTVIQGVCDWRQYLGDGHYARWTGEQLARLLLEWFPRAAFLPEDEWPAVIPALHCWLDFLDAHGLLDPRGEPLPALHRTLDTLAEEFPRAMADSGRHGVGKLLGTLMHERGLDPGDRAAFQEFVENLDDEADDTVRHRLLHARLVDLGHTDDDAGALPQLPVTLPSQPELDALAATVPVVRRLTALTRWVGPDGRALTATRRLRPADAAELARLLGTRDHLPASGRVRTADDLSHLSLLVAWAVRAGLVRKYRGRLVQVASARPLLDEPLPVFSRAFQGVFELRDQLVPLGSSPLHGRFAAVLQDVLFAVYSLPDPGAELPALENGVVASAVEGYALEEDAEAYERRWRDRITDGFREALHALTDLGVVRLTADRDGLEHLSLTALGTWAVRSRLLAAGRSAPVIGELSDADAHGLLYAMAEDHTAESGRAEIALWLAAHGAPADPSTVSPEAFRTRTDLGDALRRTPLRTRKAALLRLLTLSLPEGHAFAESLLDDADLAPLAVQSLLDSGHRTMDALTPEEGLLGLTESLAQLLELGGPEALAPQLAAQGQRMTVEILSAVAASGHPHAQRILQAATEVAGEITRLAGRPDHPHRPLRRGGPGGRGGRGGRRRFH